MRLAVLLALLFLALVRGAWAQAPGSAEREARDARLSFSSDSAARARAALVAGPVEVEERALALLALGGGRASGDLARLESALSDGKPLERRAALFALGEMGVAGMPALERALAGDLAGLEQALCVALLVAERRGAAAAGERLSALAQKEGALALAAAWALTRKFGGEAPALALDEYYDLRWRAARAYGLVDGQRGQTALAAALFADTAFRERVVVLAAAELAPEVLATHLFELLLAGERDELLRVAALRFPAELARAHQSGAWKPTLAAWQVVLAEIEAARAERHAQGLLEIAFRESSELEPLAGLLLVRAGGDLPWSWVADQLEKGDARMRSALAEACGERGEQASIPEFADLLGRRKDLGIFGEGLVALARLGHPPARTALDELLKGPASHERDQAVAALARVLHDPNLRPRAAEALRREDLAPDLRLELELGLALAGARADGMLLRRSLLESGVLEGGSERRQRLVRALARAPEQADLDLLVSLFPSESERELDVELALALLRHRHPAVNGLLRAALWSDAWNASVLAGGLIVHAGGVRALADELEAAPRSAGEADLRRVGFALGQWGGFAALEELARSHSEGDPALQGALLGALSVRAAEPVRTASLRLPEKSDATPKRAPAKGQKKRGKGGKGGKPGKRGKAGR